MHTHTLFYRHFIAVTQCLWGRPTQVIYFLHHKCVFCADFCLLVVYDQVLFAILKGPEVGSIQGIKLDSRKKTPTFMKVQVSECKVPLISKGRHNAT